jgi:hypothetical protein
MRNEVPQVDRGEEVLCSALAKEMLRIAKAYGMLMP